MISRVFIVIATVLMAFGNVHCQFLPIAGYMPTTNVTQHSRIDLDISQIEVMLYEGLAQRVNDAMSIYANGKNSAKSSSMRSIKGFSSEAGAKMKNWDLYKIYRDFYRSETYADDFITKAFLGTGEFKGKEDIMRIESIVKGMQYESVFMYIFHEMYDAIDDCNRQAPNDNDAGVNAWDEAWAFYSGSMEGVDGSGEGALHYALAEKRCADFGTCLKNKKAPANIHILGMFEAGRSALQQKDCNRALVYLDLIRKEATVPLVQGVLRYAYRADPKSGYARSATGAEEWAEGWAFTRAILPLVSKCNVATGKMLDNNFNISALGPVANGYKSVYQQLLTVYKCMGITCGDIGEMSVQVNGQKTVIFPKCDDATLSSTNSNSDLTDGAIAGITIAVIVFYFLSICLCYKRGFRAARKDNDVFKNEMAKDFPDDDSKTDDALARL